MNPQTERKVALVTGASRGIGEAIAKALARRNVVPVLGVRDPAAAEPLARALGTVALPCDMADAASIEAVVARCLALHGRLDIVVNNAGTIGPIGRLGETDPAAWREAVTVNLEGPYRLVRAALPALLDSPAPSIVNLSSGAAHAAREGWSAYCGSKAALAMLTRSLHLEYPQVATYGLQPGVVDTDMQAVIRASGINEISRIPREKLAPAERPAGVVAWLCDRRPADLAGQDLSVNTTDLMDRFAAEH
jgi:NAD(P)-dependent dehydrogenase (short-subunit alcohol dehydrogenase family)